MNFKEPTNPVPEKENEERKVADAISETGSSEILGDALADSERGEAIDATSIELRRLYMDAEKYNPFAGSWPKGEILSPIKQSLNELSSEEQEKVAQDFFDKTIGTSIQNTKNSYVVYGMFKGTAFGDKFKQLEDSRLKEAGYGGFNL